MISEKAFRTLALSFPDATEQPHFEITSFRIGKKIFATLNVEHNRATLLLPLLQQDAIVSLNPEAFSPVPNKWGTHGWTHVDLKKVKKGLLTDALEVAHAAVASKKLTSSAKSSKPSKSRSLRKS